MTKQSNFHGKNAQENASSRQAAWQEAIKLLEEPLDQSRFLMQLGLDKPMIPDIHREEYRIAGCKTNIWRDISIRDGRILFQADSDSLLVRGALAILVDMFHNAVPEEAASLTLAPLDIFDPMVLNPDILNGGLSVLLEELTCDGSRIV